MPSYFRSATWLACLLITSATACGGGGEGGDEGIDASSGGASADAGGGSGGEPGNSGGAATSGGSSGTPSGGETGLGGEGTGGESGLGGEGTGGGTGGQGGEGTGGGTGGQGTGGSSSGGSGGGPSCEGCFIDGTCVDADDLNPENACELCDPEADAGTWTAAEDGTACDDELACTGADRCAAGECVHAGAPCAGAQSCEEDASSASCCDSGEEGAECARCRLYVRAAQGDDANVGTSWGAALASVTAALDLAAPLGCEIWVAAGTYRPDSAAPWDEALTFQLRSGVDLYGGFVGDETLLEERDVVLNETILSGDLEQNDDPGDPLTYQLSSHHIVTGADDAVLDGFTISDGVIAEGESSPDDPDLSRGVGMLNIGTSPTVRNCTFHSNKSTPFGAGAGMYNRDGAAPTITDCTFQDNDVRPNGNGGAIANFDQAAPVIQRCDFIDNGAFGGGAIFNSAAAGEIRESTFSGNMGGAVQNYNGTTTLIADSQFSANSRGLSNMDSSPQVIGCSFSANSYGGASNEDSYSEFVDCTFEGNTGAQGSGAANWGGAVTFNGCVFTGNIATSIYGGGALFADGDAQVTVVNSRFSSNNATYVGGAIMSFRGAVVDVANSVFNENYSPYGGAINVELALVNVDTSTFVFNQAGEGQAVRANTAWDGVAFVTNSILWNNDFYGVTVTSSNTSHNTGDPANLHVDPLFVEGDPAFHLQAGSPCIDAGDAAALPLDVADVDGDGDTGEVLPLDMDGNARLEGANVDMGAYEYAAP